VNNYCDRLGFLTTLTIMLLAAQTTLAAERQITGIEVEKHNNEVELKLSAPTDTDTDDNASFFTVRNGNTIEANLLNTHLDLPQGDSFKQENLIPGVKAVEINQVDQKHTRITISTEDNVPIEHLLEQQGKDFVLSLNGLTKTQSFQKGLQDLSQDAIKNIKQTYKSVIGHQKTKGDEKLSTTSSKNASEDSDVLIPNPEIVISNGAAGSVNEDKEGLTRTFSAPPENLPRAAAPPVGDMAVSNISTVPDTVDLGSSALVPRLVLRDAPVREVLSLLARSANLNVVFAASNTGESEGSPTGETDGAGEEGPTISLDLENQPVQEVFNSVLLVSGLNANRQGNIIYVGEQLPAQARNLISRTIRLNQVQAENAALYLASQGAKGKRLTSEVEETIDPDTGRVTQRKETNPELSDLDGGSEDDTGTEALLLQGLQVSTDSRLNAITLVGEPRKVETATAFITQLDARRRQVAVNVKVIDVNLLNQDVVNSSFSFGVNDNFFVQDKGSAALNFGGVNPPETKTVTTRGGFPRVTPLPLPEGTKESAGFIDQLTVDAPYNNSGTSFINGLEFFGRGPFGTTENAFQPGVAEAKDGTLTFELPSLYEVPDKFLALLEAKITSGNAKILTDPTLMVQEGQQATVKLAQNIVESVKTEVDGETGTRTITPVIAEAGVVLTVNVERIDDNGFVSMSVSPTVSSIGATQNFDSGGGAVNLLNLLSKRELNSGLVRMRDGQTLILSGIIQDQERTTITKVPILGDIPLLGSLFRSTDKANERAEVIVLLTPEIVEEDAGIGSNYSPSEESREILKQEGVALPGDSLK
jgi:type IV pilus assembly protein PilQ